MINPTATIALLASIALLTSQPVLAQSSADYTAWRNWCLTVGTPSGTPSNPVCIPRSQGSPSSGYSGPSADEIARQARERQQREEAKRQEEARRQAEAAQKQRRFIAERDAAAQTLRGGTGTPFFGAGSLKGESPAGVQIRDIKPAAETRDLGGAQAVWKQLNCAASLSGSAFAALRRRSGPDYDEFNYMAREATNALNGDPVGVVCPAAPTMPKLDPAKSKIKYLLFLERMKSYAAKLKQTQADRKSSLDKLIEAKHNLLELGGADAKGRVELASLEKQRQSLGPLTNKAAAVPPPPTQAPSKQTAEDARKSAMAEALAAARAADAAYNAVTQSETATQADLKRMNDIAAKLEKGEPAAANLLNQMFP